MVEINLAYEILCDSRKRKQYDMKNDILHSTSAPSAAQNNDQTRISGQYYDDCRKEKEGNSQNAQSQFYLAICLGYGSAARKEDKFCCQCGLDFGIADSEAS